MNETCFLAKELRGAFNSPVRPGREHISVGKDYNDDEAVECGAGPRAEMMARAEVRSAGADAGRPKPRARRGRGKKAACLRARGPPSHLASGAGNRTAERGRRAAGTAAAETGGARTPGTRAA